MNETDLLAVSVKAEEALLGSLLLDREAIAAVAGKIPVEAFCRGRHRVIWQAALNLWERREPPDPITVIAEVRAMGIGSDRLEDQVILDLMAAVPTAVHVGYYGERVLQFARRRAIARSGSDLVRRAYDDEAETETGDLVATVRDAVEPFEPVGEDAIATLGEAAEDAVYASLAAWDGKKDERVLPTGIRQLDSLLGGGVRRQQLLVIGARPSMGKSAIMVHLGLSMRAHLASMEMNREEVVQRMIAHLANVPYRTGTAPIGDISLRNRWLQAAEQAQAIPTTITDKPQTTFQVETDVARLAAETGTEVVVIDHLDFLADRFKSDDENYRTGQLVRRCKMLAKSCNVAVIVLAQLNRNPEHRTGFVPHLSDLRNSGAIEQDADVVGLLYRRRYYSGKGQLEPDTALDYYAGSNLERAELIIAKNRNGPTDSVLLGWEPETMKFHERIV